jgi:endoglycosylceramidase
VRAAWNHFYDDTDGIRTSFAATWGAVAERFAGRPEVAGYDLLNEPEVSRPAAELAPLYDALVRDVVTEIRAAEDGADFQHLLFVEPAIPAGEPLYGIVVPDPARIGLPLDNVVAAPHNYAEAIGPPNVTIEQMNELFLGVAGQLGVPTWLGEHGFWDTSPETLAALRRFAADQDRHVLGGAWWQWRQPCGDPHSVPYGGYAATGTTSEITHLNALSCPGDGDLGLTDELAQVVGRAYPRIAPGRITLLESDPDTGALRIEGEHRADDELLVVWVPSMDGLELDTSGFYDVKVDDYAGGSLIVVGVRPLVSAEASGTWSLTLTPSCQPRFSVSCVDPESTHDTQNEVNQRLRCAVRCRVWR